MTLKLGIGRSFVRTAGSGVAHGPTVQIARSPTSIALSSGSPTANITFTALDANGVATGARVYGVSSDPTITTITKDAPWTATKVATGTTAVLYGQLTDPSPGAVEPVYSAGTDELILSDDFSNNTYYSAVVGMDTNAVDQTLRFVPVPSRLYSANDINTDFNKIVTPGRNGATRALRGHNFGSGGGDGSIWGTYPYADALAGADPLKAVVCQWWNRITAAPEYAGDARKYIMMWHPGNLGRIQFNSHGNSPWVLSGVPAEAGGTIWQVHDMSFGVTGNIQARGPFMPSLNNSGWHKNTVFYQAHTPNTGTMMIGVKTADVTFASDQAGVLVNGDVIALKKPDGSSASASGFVLSGFDGHSGGHVARTALAITKTYSGAMSAMSNVTRCGVFDTSQAGEPTMVNGVVLAVNDVNGASFGQQTMTNFNGTTSCDVAQATFLGDINTYNFDVGGMPFSSKNDGIARMWLDGTKLIDLSAAVVGQSPADGFKVWCTAEDLGSLAVNSGVNSIMLGGEQTTASVATDMDFADFLWYRTARRT